MSLYCCPPPRDDASTCPACLNNLDSGLCDCDDAEQSAACRCPQGQEDCTC